VFSRYQRPVIDHFEPEVDAETQRSLRGLLEKIDYTAFASNKEVIGSAIPTIDETRFQRLAVVAAHARSRWVLAALDASDKGAPATAVQVEGLAALRASFEELTAAYEALRRMVERGYVKLAATPR
jgi:hypothetical protein